MKERPILFSAPMVQAILAGNKTQTRRTIKWPIMDKTIWFELDEGYGPDLVNPKEPIDHLCPYGKIGDQLWVREKSRIGSSGWHHIDGGWYCIDYAAGGSSMRNGEAPKHYPELSHNKDFSLRWQPSIHMPRWASRIQLEITNIRVERLQDINEADAKAEGCDSDMTEWGSIYWFHGVEGYKSGKSFADSAKEAFTRLWETINGPDSWTANPWVWVIEFKRVERPA